MKSAIQKINLINDKVLTIGLLPSSYLVSMTYEEQLLWLCNYLENTLLPKLNELINTFNTDTETLEEAVNGIIDLVAELRQEMADLSDSVDDKLDQFMLRIADNLNEIANTILNEKIENGEILVSLGMTYDETDESLTFSINSEVANALIEDLATLTTPEESEG